MANKKRLIDCEQAKRATYEEIFWTESEQAVVRNFLAKLPKVEAVELVHGRWNFHKKKVWGLWEDSFYECSNCRSRNPLYNFNYCPNCGAKMDGDS